MYLAYHLVVSFGLRVPHYVHACVFLCLCGSDGRAFSSSFVGSIRSPGDVVPQDVDCEGFGITYTRIASDKTVLTSPTPTAMENDVDRKVDDSIESFLRTLSQIGPELMSVGSF